MAARKNPGGGKGQDKIWSDALRRAVMRESDTVPGLKRIEVMADQCSRMGESGDLGAMKEIGDRLDGKPTQQLSHTDNDGNPVAFIMNLAQQVRDEDK